MQIAYPFTLAITGITSAIEPYRRYSYNSGGAIALTPWESMSPIPVGAAIWANGTATVPGFINENASLVARASYPRLWECAQPSGNLGKKRSGARTRARSRPAACRQHFGFPIHAASLFEVGTTVAESTQAKRRARTGPMRSSIIRTIALTIAAMPTKTERTKRPFRPCCQLE